MGTLTMALAAVMLAGSAPEKVSGETRQALDLSGPWEGTFSWQRGIVASMLLEGRTSRAGKTDFYMGRRVVGMRGACDEPVFTGFTAEADGRFHCESAIPGRGCFGTCKACDDSIVFWFYKARQPTPGTDTGSEFLILRRPKPRK